MHHKCTRQQQKWQHFEEEIQDDSEDKNNLKSDEDIYYANNIDITVMLSVFDMGNIEAD